MDSSSTSMTQAHVFWKGVCVSGCLLSTVLPVSRDVCGTQQALRKHTLLISYSANCVDTLSPRNFSFCLVLYISKLYMSNSEANCSLFYEKQLSFANLSTQFLLLGGNHFQLHQLFGFFKYTFLTLVIYKILHVYLNL